MFFSLQPPKPPCAPSHCLSVCPVAVHPWQRCWACVTGVSVRGCCRSSKLCSRGNGEEAISPTVGRRQRWMGRQLRARAKRRQGSELHRRQLGSAGSAQAPRLHYPIPSSQENYSTPKWHHQIWLQGVLCLLVIWLQSGPCFNGLSRQTGENCSFPV